MAELNSDTERMNILLVEDDPAVRKVTTQLLEHLKCNVVAVADGQDAIRRIKDQDNCFDLVMTDYSMPDMNGIELAMSLKRLLPDMPVILCTGADSGTDDRFMLESGVTAILSKPFTTNELDCSIRRAIER